MHHVAKDDLDLLILLPLHPKCRDYRLVPLGLAFSSPHINKNRCRGIRGSSGEYGTYLESSQMTVMGKMGEEMIASVFTDISIIME